MEHSLETLLSRMEDILEDNAFTAYLYGSVRMEDFRWGWSDIDLLCLTEREFSASQARRLAGLRQELQAAEPDNRYFRLFEGGVLPFGCYESGGEADAAYWGTSGQRVTRRFEVSVFTRLEILDMGRLVHGRERRGEMRRPGYPELREGVAAHYAVIRRHALPPAANLHTAGWMLDIARCLYSLRTGGINQQNRRRGMGDGAGAVSRQAGDGADFADSPGTAAVSGGCGRSGMAGELGRRDPAFHRQAGPGAGTGEAAPGQLGFRRADPCLNPFFESADIK